jgi:hypothetical protein
MTITLTKQELEAIVAKVEAHSTARSNAAIEYLRVNHRSDFDPRMRMSADFHPLEPLNEFKRKYDAEHPALTLNDLL